MIDMVCKTHVKKMEHTFQSSIGTPVASSVHLHHLYFRLLACHVHIIQLLSESNLSAASINQSPSITTLVASQKPATLEAILATINSVQTGGSGNRRRCEKGKGEHRSSLDTPVALIG